MSLGPGRRLVGGAHAALPDTGAVHDPLVAGADAAGLEIGVGELAVGHGQPPSGDGRSDWAGAPGHARRSQATGWPSGTRSPPRASIPTRKPPKGLRTGVEEPGPSTTPMACPAVMSSPASVRSTSVSARGRKTPTVGATITRSGTARTSPGTGTASITGEPPRGGRCRPGWRHR